VTAQPVVMPAVTELTAPGVDAGRHRRDREDAPGRLVLAGDQIPRECLPQVPAAVPEAAELTLMIGRIQPFEPVQEQLERGGPAPGQRPALLRQMFRRSAEPHRDQLGRFAEREAQVGGRHLEQLTPPLRAAEPQLGQAPAGQHQMER
jgi:hypothetical protein